MTNLRQLAETADLETARKIIDAWRHEDFGHEWLAVQVAAALASAKAPLQAKIEQLESDLADEARAVIEARDHLSSARREVDALRKASLAVVRESWGGGISEESLVALQQALGVKP